MSESFHEALRRTAFAIEIAKALAKSQQLCFDIFEEMDAAEDLFKLFGIEIPYQTYMHERHFFQMMKPAVQELAIQTMNIARFHEDAASIVHYIKNTRISRKLDENAVRKVYWLIKEYPLAFNLDGNNYPRKQAAYSTPVNAFEHHSFAKLNYIFVKDMEEFYATPIPRVSSHTGGGLRADGAEFYREIRQNKIMLAY